jgi:DNA-binding IclR family transcriptional regulator
VDTISGVQTLDRAVGLLETVAAQGSASLAELVAATQLSRPTTHRLALACERHGLLARAEDGRFRLGGRLVGWAAQASGPVGLARAAGPVLERLVELTGESAQLYVREGDRRICIATHERRSGLRDTVPVGAVMPLDLGSGGKVLLAWAPDRGRFGLDAALSAVRTAGFAQTSGEREPGVASVSAPVRDATGTVVAAVSVSGPAERIGPDPGARWAGALLEAAADVAAGVTSR